MNSIYLLESDTSQFRSLLPPGNEEFVSLVERFDGKPIGAAWIPVRVDYDPDSMNLPASDYPSILLPHIPVFSVEATNVLGSILINHGELLPLKCGDIDYFAFNPTVVVDALNLDGSEIIHYSSGRIMDVKRYVLDAHRVGSAPIFKVRGTELLAVFVNEEFMRVVGQAGLDGFLFHPIAIL